MNYTLKGIIAAVTVFIVTLAICSVSGSSFVEQRGISYAAWWSGIYSTPEADLSLAKLAATGANWISLIVTGYQETIHSTSINYTSEATPTDKELIHVIDKAHELGLKVMLKPHVDLSNDPEHWRGEIGQDFTEEDWIAWFTSYRSFIEHYATLSASYGADQFCVGAELVSTAHREHDWRTVIALVRSTYVGPITYAANHGGEETSITWWDAVDYLGVDAYYSLSETKEPTLSDLLKAWEPYLNTLTNLAATWEKPILFTEIGYRSVDGTTMKPWDWQSEGEVDLREQAIAYLAAFFNTYKSPWLSGIFWWTWSTDPREGGFRDDGYTPHRKPAEKILRFWYNKPK